MSVDPRAELLRFDPALPVERARTPPASWYLDPTLAEWEQRAVFGNEWIAVALSRELAEPGSQLGAELAGLPVLLVRDAQGKLAAFHNACRHHGTLLVSGACQGERIRCPYHGWSYQLDGSLATAPSMGGARDFDAAANGLRPLACAEACGLVFVQRMEGSPRPAEPPPLPPELLALDRRLSGMAGAGLRFVARRSYRLECNWKVFVDNFLDGGYHVQAVHPELAGLLDLDSYKTEVDGRVSIQTCRAAGGEHRLGDAALYAFVHPNLMLNRYGNVLDVNRVLPRGSRACEVIMDWAFADELDEARRARCLEQSELVQAQDVAVCEAVQRGLASPGYDRGCYAPRLEHGAHAFHRLLAGALRATAPGMPRGHAS